MTVSVYIPWGELLSRQEKHGQTTGHVVHNFRLKSEH